MAISFDKQRNKFRASVVENGKRKYLGRFNRYKDAEHAIAQYYAKSEISDEEFAAKLASLTFEQTPQKNTRPKPSFIDKLKNVWQRKRNGS